MAYLKRMKFGRRGKENSLLTSDKSQNEVDEGVVEEVDEAGIFDDFDGEKNTVEEWWLQKGVEEAVEEEPEVVEEIVEDKEERKGNEDDLIYSLKGDDDEDEEENIVLKKALEELGETGVDELLELGQTALHELEERIGMRE